MHVHVEGTCPAWFIDGLNSCWKTMALLVLRLVQYWLLGSIHSRFLHKIKKKRISSACKVFMFYPLYICSWVCQKSNNNVSGGNGGSLSCRQMTRPVSLFILLNANKPIKCKHYIRADVCLFSVLVSSTFGGQLCAVVVVIGGPFESRGSGCCSHRHSAVIACNSFCLAHATTRPDRTRSLTITHTHACAASEKGMAFVTSTRRGGGHRVSPTMH